MSDTGSSPRVVRLTGRHVTKVGGSYQSIDGSRAVCFYESEGHYGLVVYEMGSAEARVVVEGKQPVRHCQ